MALDMWQDDWDEEEGQKGHDDDKWDNCIPMDREIMAKQRLGRNLWKLRNETGITLAEAAWRMGVADSTFKSWERGRTAPRAHMLLWIEKKLGWTVAQMLEGVEF